MRSALWANFVYWYRESDDLPALAENGPSAYDCEESHYREDDSVAELIGPGKAIRAEEETLYEHVQRVDGEEEEQDPELADHGQKDADQSDYSDPDQVPGLVVAVNGNPRDDQVVAAGEQCRSADGDGRQADNRLKNPTTYAKHVPQKQF
jgi:hypothetical protein